jgi:hypothetical protein
MSTEQKYATMTPHYVLPAAELGKVAAELSELMRLEADPKTPWADGVKAQARIAELRRTLDSDARGRAIMKREAEATNTRHAPDHGSGRGGCGCGRECVENVIRRDRHGRPMEVQRLIQSNSKTATNATDSEKYAPPVPPHAPKATGRATNAEAGRTLKLGAQEFAPPVPYF